jgi:ABC transporter substrate binding protein
MKRRELLLLLGGAMTAARVLCAQQKAMPVIGFLGGASPGPNAPFVAAFHQGLSETGYVEGQNLAIEYRWAEGQYDRLPALAADLVSRKVDLIVATSGGPLSALAAKNATSTIPIVFSMGGDPVGSRGDRYGLPHGGRAREFKSRLLRQSVLFLQRIRGPGAKRRGVRGGCRWTGTPPGASVPADIPTQAADRDSLPAAHGRVS